MIPDYRSLITSGKSDELAAHAERLVGYPVPPNQFLKSCQEHSRGLARERSNWSECTWTMFFKNRAEQWRPEPGCTTPPHSVSCLLHVGFVSVSETEKQLGRLPELEPAAEPAFARSKIGSTTQIIHPVDAVAARVAPTEV